jgi:hypothetical protein
VVAVIVSAGASTHTLAANERLLRLTGGVDLIGAQSRFVAGTAGGLTAGQLASAGVLAALPIAYPTFAILMTGSGLVRLVLATRIEVSAAWSTSTAAFDVAELRRGATHLPPPAEALPPPAPLLPPPAVPLDDRGGDPP